MRLEMPPDPSRDAIFVAEDGSDRQGDGTFERPYQSVGWATQMAAKMQVKTLVLRGGRYPVGNTIYPPAGLSYRAYRDEVPVISGGRVVSPASVAGDIVRFPRRSPSRQLYIDGRKAPLSRSQFYKLLHWWDVPGIDPAERLRTTGRVIAINTSDYQAAGSPGLGSVMVVQKDWADVYLPVSGATTTGSKTFISFTPAIERVAFEAAFPFKYDLQSYHFENISSPLAPGSWYWDANFNYYRLAQNETATGIVAIVPEASTLLDVSSSDVSFEGITFAETNWFPRLGKHTFQADSQIYIDDSDPSIAAAVRCSAAQMRTRRCRFTRLGGNGIGLGRGCDSPAIEGNDFDGLAGGGITVAGQTFKDSQFSVDLVSYAQNPASASEVRNVLIKNNRFRNFAQEFYGSTAIFCAYVRNYEISNNRIDPGPYTAISVGWGWSTAPTYHQNGSIFNNSIFSPGSLMTDGGAIYTLGAAPGSQISANIIDGIAASSFPARRVNAAIYLDSGSQGFAGNSGFYANLSPIDSGGDLVAPIISNAQPGDNALVAPLPDTDPGWDSALALSGPQNHWSNLRN